MRPHLLATELRHRTRTQIRRLRPSFPIPAMSSNRSTHLLNLPLEIRLIIYEHLFETTSDFFEGREQKLPHPLVSVCKQLRRESLPILMSGFELTLSTTGRLEFRPVVTAGKGITSCLPGVPRSWNRFCNTKMVYLVPLCGQIHIWYPRINIGVTITPQKNTSPRIRVSELDEKDMESMKNLTPDMLDKTSALTAWLLELELRKALAEWKSLCSTMPLSVDVVDQIVRELDCILYRAIRCDRHERSIEWYYSVTRLVRRSELDDANWREVLLADLRRVWHGHGYLPAGGRYCPLYCRGHYV